MGEDCKGTPLGFMILSMPAHHCFSRLTSNNLMESINSAAWWCAIEESCKSDTLLFTSPKGAGTVGHSERLFSKQYLASRSIAASLIDLRLSGETRNFDALSDRP